MKRWVDINSKQLAEIIVCSIDCRFDYTESVNELLKFLENDSSETMIGLPVGGPNLEIKGE